MEGRGEVDGLLRPASEGARLATAAGRLLQVSRVEWVVAAQPAQLIHAQLLHAALHERARGADSKNEDEILASKQASMR